MCYRYATSNNIGVEETKEAERKMKEAYTRQYDVFGSMAKEIIVDLDTDFLCSYAVTDKAKCMAFANGLLRFGLSRAMYMLISIYQQDYFLFLQHLRMNSYTPTLAREMLQRPIIYLSEDFVYDYLYPTFTKYMGRLMKQIRSYYREEQVQDQIDYTAAAIAIIFAICTVWVKLLYMLKAQMWRTKAILVFLPSEFMEHLDKRSQTFILSILKK